MTKKTNTSDNLYLVLQNIAMNENTAVFKQEAFLHINLDCVFVENFQDMFDKNLKELINYHNQFRYKGLYYTFKPNIRYGGFFAMMYAHGYLNKEFKPKNNYLRQIIDEVVTKVLEDNSNSKKMAFLKAFFKYENSTYFIHDYFHYLIRKSAVTNYQFKLTKTSINLMETLVHFLFTQAPELNLLSACWDHNHSLALSPSDINKIKNIVNLLFEDDPAKFYDYLITIKIPLKSIQKIIKLYYTYYLCYHFESNQIYLEDIKLILKSNVIKIDLRKLDHELTCFYVSYGETLIELLAMTKTPGFILKMQQNNLNQSRMLILTHELVEDVLLTKFFQKPYLDTTQLSKNDVDNNNDRFFSQYIIHNDQRIVHPNPRIKLKFKKNCYFFITKIYTKLSIDINYLTKFLELLVNESLDTMLYSLFKINYNKYQKLCKIPYMKDILDTMFQDINKFKEIVTVSKMKARITLADKEHFEKIKQRFETCTNDKQKILIEKERQQSLWAKKEYKIVINDMMNKYCQRKIQLITVIQEAIDFSIYKYFINTSYVDTRGRTYLSANALNILSSPFAKLFVKLYDDTLGALPTLPVLNAINNTLKFPGPRLKLNILIKECLTEFNKNEVNFAQQIKLKRNESMVKYIQIYLDMKTNVILELIRHDKYFTYDNLLFQKIIHSIKKPETIFYVHSLIYYEQLYYRDLEDSTIINYYREDASTSGFQVMAAFFRNPQLAEISNLTGDTNFDLYDKARQHVYDIYIKLRNFVEVGLEWFDASPLLKKNLALASRRYTQEDYNKLCASTQLDHYIEHLININIIESSMGKDLLLNLIDIILCNNVLSSNKNKLIIDGYPEIIDFLSQKEITLIQNFSKLEKFKENTNELKYILCFRYALRQVIIVTQILQISDKNPSLWFTKNLAKNHIMTTIYKSTSYSRATQYLKLITDYCNVKNKDLILAKEFANFLEKSTATYLATMPIIQRIFDFVAEICKNKPLIMNTEHFEITMTPHITQNIQVSCTSHKPNKRGPQLVIKKITEIFDQKRLNSMVPANIAHVLDADIVHRFTQIIRAINKIFENDKDLNYRLIFERNHDCFIFNYPPLLKPLIEEAYLQSFKQNHMANIEGVTPEILQKYQDLTTDAFLLLLENINPYFVK